ncbi:MAG: branched-chain amino acid ABC transporter permease [Thermoflexales bacterium]|nr:branched-chain amino acid ABC transporter permease [Thermoflexales bacterium]
MGRIRKDPNLILLTALLGAALLLPLAIRSNQYALVLLTTILLYGVLATAWNIIGGLAGQLDLAAGAYLGLGAFTTGTLLIRWNVSPWLGMILGGLVAVGFALIVGYPLFRFGVKEVWYALSSAALVEVLRVTFLIWSQVGGPVERYLPYHEWSLYHLRFATYLPFFYIMLGMLVLALLVNHWIRQSRLGYYLMALGENEEAAEVLGVNTQSCKLEALAIYAFIVGVTGGIYACMYGFIHPNFFSGPMSTEVAILGIVGGLGVTYGPVMAAILLVSVRELLRAQLGGQLEGLYLVVYSVVLILIALFRPQGLGPLVRQAYGRLLSRVAKE